MRNNENKFEVGDSVTIPTGEIGTVTMSWEGQIQVRWNNGLDVAYTAWQIANMPIIKR